VTIQQIGGAPKERVVEMMNANAELIPVSVAGEKFLKLLEKPVDLNSVVGWVNFYRRDDVSSTAYFYLDRPESGLPALAPVNQRTQ
jgi:hypothetical protein